MLHQQLLNSLELIDIHCKIVTGLEMDADSQQVDSEIFICVTELQYFKTCI